MVLQDKRNAFGAGEALRLAVAPEPSSPGLPAPKTLRPPSEPPEEPSDPRALGNCGCFATS